MKDFDRRGWAAFIPSAFLAASLVGVITGYAAKPDLWADLAKIIAFYAAGVAVNAILLAICWAAFSRVFDILGDEDFGRWMRLNGASDSYEFYISFIELTQMTALTAMGGALLLSLLDGVSVLINRMALGVAVGTSVYAIYWARGCVRIMRELSSQRATFKEHIGTVKDLSSERKRGA